MNIKYGLYMSEQKDYKIQTRASESQLQARQNLLNLFLHSPLEPDHLLVNLALYMRSSVLAKILYVNELYQHIIYTPGVIMEFGVWWGANLALFESLRAVYEPYNHARKIIGFDTFAGYPAIRPEDGGSELAIVGGYSVPPNYEQYLKQLLDYHEQENVLAHIKKYELVQGDVCMTIEEYIAKHPETIIALAYFDLQLYEPTKACLQAIRPFITRGTVIAMDELNSAEFPGETIAFREVFGLNKYKLRRSRFLPDRSYLIVE
jgi:macrocin-O-methyltransferase TylF-like protien